MLLCINVEKLHTAPLTNVKQMSHLYNLYNYIKNISNSFKLNQIEENWTPATS